MRGKLPQATISSPRKLFVLNMADENLLEFLHFELVNYCVNDKKVSRRSLRLDGSFALISCCRTEFVKWFQWNQLFHLIFYFQDNEAAIDSTKSISTLEYIGFSTGYRLIERLTREMPRFKDELDSVK